MACIEAGITGQDLEKELAKYGMCTGHEPVTIIVDVLGFHGVFNVRRMGFNESQWNEEERVWEY